MIRYGTVPKNRILTGYFWQYYRLALSLILTLFLHQTARSQTEPICTIELLGEYYDVHLIGPQLGTVMALSNERLLDRGIFGVDNAAEAVGVAGAVDVGAAMTFGPFSAQSFLDPEHEIGVRSQAEDISEDTGLIVGWRKQNATAPPRPFIVSREMASNSSMTSIPRWQP